MNEVCVSTGNGRQSVCFRMFKSLPELTPGNALPFPRKSLVNGRHRKRAGSYRSELAISGPRLPIGDIALHPEVRECEEVAASHGLIAFLFRVPAGAVQMHQPYGFLAVALVGNIIACQTLYVSLRTDTKRHVPYVMVSHLKCRYFIQRRHTLDLARESGISGKISFELDTFTGP